MFVEYREIFIFFVKLCFFWDIALAFLTSVLRKRQRMSFFENFDNSSKVVWIVDAWLIICARILRITPLYRTLTLTMSWFFYYSMPPYSTLSKLWFATVIAAQDFALLALGDINGLPGIPSPLPWISACGGRPSDETQGNTIQRYGETKDHYFINLVSQPSWVLALSKVQWGFGKCQTSGWLGY